MIQFIKIASEQEFFTNKHIQVHPQTFRQLSDILSRYGFLLILSRKPLLCKLLRHHFLIELLDYYKFKITFYEPKKKNLSKVIDKELKKFKKNYKLNYSIIEELNNKIKIKFIFTSLNLEGNPLTLPQTQKLILEDLTPFEHSLIDIKEVVNYKKAIDLMIINSNNKIKLDLDLILKYHSLAMNQIEKSGMLRDVDVIINNNPNFITSEIKNIKEKIKNLLEKYDEFNKIKKKEISKIISFASYFHNEFQRIHPFIDGNSRISRLLLLHILRSNDLPILDLPIGYFDQYLDLTKRSKKRDDSSFEYLIQEVILMNLKNINLNF